MDALNELTTETTMHAINDNHERITVRVVRDRHFFNRAVNPVRGGAIGLGAVNGSREIVAVGEGGGLGKIAVKPELQRAMRSLLEVDGSLSPTERDAMMRMFVNPVADGNQSAVPQAVPSDDTDTSSGYWNCEQTAKYVKLTPKTVREGALKGTLPGHKYPAQSSRGRWRFKREEIDRWLSRKPQEHKTKGVTVW